MAYAETLPDRSIDPSIVRRLLGYRQALQAAAQQQDLTSIRRTTQQYADLAEERLGRHGSVLACFAFLQLATFANEWSDPGGALQGALLARRSCRNGRIAPPILEAALDGQQGMALLALGRAPEAGGFLERSVADLRRIGFPEPNISAEAGIAYSQFLAARGSRIEARDLLLEIKREMDSRASFQALEARVDLLLALSQNSTARGAIVEAANWAQHAENLLRTNPALRQSRSVSVAQQLAATGYYRFGGQARPSQRYEALIADQEGRQANRGYQAFLRSLRGLYLFAEGRAGEAAAEIRRAQAMEATVRFAPGFHRGYLNVMTQYFLSVRDCPNRVLYARRGFELVRSDRRLAELVDNQRQAYALSLSACGRAPEAIRLLRPVDGTGPLDEWPDITRRWSLALVYAEAGDHVRAAGEFRIICDAIDRRAGSGLRGSRELYSPESVTVSAATCYQDLTGSLIAAGRAPAANGERTATGSFDAVTFNAAQRAVQTDVDDGVSFRLGLASAERRGTQAETLVMAYEVAQRELANLQRALEDALVTARGETDAALEQRMAAQRGEVDRLRARINTELPDYWRARAPQPVQIEVLQGNAARTPVLRDGEAALLILVSDDPRQRNFVFAVSRTDSAVAGIALPTSRIRSLVTSLREQIQPAAVGREPPPPGAYDLGASHELYSALFGDPRIQQVIGRARVLSIVTSGPLGRFPFATLVTEPPGTSNLAVSPEQFRQAPWLIKRHAIAMYPTLSALVQLRQGDRPPPPSESFLAFADPDVSLVRRIASLPGPAMASRASPSERGTAVSAEIGYPELDDLSPQGKIEMEDIARILGAPVQSVVTGSQLRETALKQLDRSGGLARYRVIGFATHGLLPGNTGLLWEPALALSVPTPGEGEDGLLTASEIAGMRLNADLVLLSACNTGSDETGRSLVALSRAFLQAGARSLIVTHWRVRNDLGPLLLPGMLARERADGAAGSAEAMREAMLAVMRNDAILGWHPAQWAAYVLVGDANWSRRVERSAGP